MDACVLCAFRTRLLVAALRARCKEHGWLKAAGKPRTAATPLLAAAGSLVL